MNSMNMVDSNASPDNVDLDDLESATQTAVRQSADAQTVPWYKFRSRSLVAQQVVSDREQLADDNHNQAEQHHPDIDDRSVSPSEGEGSPPTTSPNSCMSPQMSHTPIRHGHTQSTRFAILRNGAAESEDRSTSSRGRVSRARRANRTASAAGRASQGRHAHAHRAHFTEDDPRWRCCGFHVTFASQLLDQCPVGACKMWRTRQTRVEEEGEGTTCASVLSRSIAPEGASAKVATISANSDNGIATAAKDRVIIFKGGDWDRKNRLNKWWVRDCAGASQLFLDAVPTFDSPELLTYDQLVFYTVVACLFGWSFREELLGMIRAWDRPPLIYDIRYEWNQD